MADNIENVKIPAGVWVDLYDQTGITVGESIAIENVGACEIKLAVSETQPLRSHQSFNTLSQQGETLRNSAGDSGAWAYSNNQDGLVSVRAVDSGHGFYPELSSGGGSSGGLTNAQLRASEVAVSDDYAIGEVLPDQSSAGLMTFTFSQPVVSFWVAVIGDSGVVKVDHYGGTPSATRGIPVEAGGILPIPEPAQVVKAFAPTGVTVTLWGQRRA